MPERSGVSWIASSPSLSPCSETERSTTLHVERLKRIKINLERGFPLDTEWGVHATAAELLDDAIVRERLADHRFTPGSSCGAGGLGNGGRSAMGRR